MYKFCPYCAVQLQNKKINGEQVKICAVCGFIYWNNPKPVVSIILIQANKVLMLRRASEPFLDFWVLPGGFIGANETPQQAIFRETREETSLVPKVTKIVGVYRIDNDPRGVHIDIVYAGVYTGEIKLSSEHNEYALYPTVNLPEHIAYKHREAIRDYFIRRPS